MATTSIQESSIQGSLYELVARGQKDTFFVRDISSSYHPYSARYDSVVPYICERRTTVPLNAPTFGNTFEVPLEPYGDILTEVNLLVELPTWLPPLMYYGSSTNPRRVNNYYWIVDDVSSSYGYVNVPGYFLFEKIQFYQDQILLQEWSGDGLLATGLTEGTWNSEFLALAQAGQVGALGSADARTTALRATPGKLRIKLPVVGCQVAGDPGFPLCCATNQNFRFRIKLRSLQDLVVGVDASGIPISNPQPWTRPYFQYIQDGQLTPTTFTPISLTSIGQPTILLETSQAYVPIEIKEDLRDEHLSIPFRRQFENIFTMGPLDYKPFDVGNGVEDRLVAVTRRLDARHPCERLVFFFRGQDCIGTHRLDNFVNSIGTRGGQFYNNMKLIIAGQDREYIFDSLVWQNLNAHAKDDRDTGLNIGEMKWSLGDVYERVKPAPRQPEGTINFTTADRPTLYIELQDVLIGDIGKRTEMRVFMEGWGVYEFMEGRGRMVYAN